MENEKKEQGHIFVPYIIINVATMINGEYVWYRNKWKNLLLKIKHFFIKPKYLKNAKLYLNKPINSKYYTTQKIKK